MFVAKKYNHETLRHIQDGLQIDVKTAILKETHLWLTWDSPPTHLRLTLPHPEET